MKILVTGAAGFIGHHIVSYLLSRTSASIETLDRLDFSSNARRLKEIALPANRHRLRFHFHDLRAEINPQLRAQIGEVDAVIHCAASTHVDRSITNPMGFVLDNVVGTVNILEYARERARTFVQLSTDEVFGPAPQGVKFKEWDRYKSGNPYAASKAGAEEMCVAYANTYRMDVRILHCMNVFGERQHPEKMIPMTVKKVRDGERVIIHADATKTKPGSRFYIHARNVASAAMFVLEQGERGEKYNVVGEREVDNLTLAQIISAFVGKKLDYELTDFHSSRPGHDLRYALDGETLAVMGWRAELGLESALERTVRWSLDNPRWLLG